jgi:hypothetical protein
MAPPRAMKSTARPMAVLKIDGRNVHLGRWDTRDDVALARDRAALHFGLVDRALAFPDRAKALGPASPEELRREAKLAYRARTATSRYLGVSWGEQQRKWFAQVIVAGTF